MKEKRLFLREAIKEGVHLERPKNTSSDQWSKQRKIGFRYAFQDITLEELGRQYGGTRENSRGLNRKFLNNIHRMAPLHLQAEYPRETIPDSKPLSQKSREINSEVRGGISLRIKKATEERGITIVGVEDIDNIARAAGVTKKQVPGSRPVLESWGIYINRVVPFAQQLSKEKDDKKLQKLLDDLSDASLRGHLARDSSRETLTTVLAIAREIGFRFHNRQVGSIAEKIKKAGIPMRQTLYVGKNRELIGSYYIVYTKHTNRIAEVLTNDPELQRFR